MYPSDELLKTQRDGSRLTLTLNRPAIHNALNDVLIDQLKHAIARAGNDPSVRLVVIAGEGRSFCAGADLGWMKSMVGASIEQSKADASRLVAMLDAIVFCPKPVIARVHGAALGGGMGFIAACDLVAATPRAQFGLTEVRLGIVPAMIFPYLVRKVQRHHLLWAALTGSRFRADRAAELGLVNQVSDEIDSVIDEWQAELAECGPQALGGVKTLFHQVPQLDWSSAQAMTTDMIAAIRVGEEGQEGMRAFLEKRPAAWKMAPKC